MKIKRSRRERNRKHKKLSEEEKLICETFSKLLDCNINKIEKEKADNIYNGILKAI